MPTNFARTAALSVAALLAVPAGHAQQPTQTLLATPTTVAWGFYSAQAKPVLTIKSGDTLSAISLLFYGNANKYPQIAKANNLADPNNVPIGTTLQLPVLS